jgi:di/tricarboxylate transporter
VPLDAMFTLGLVAVLLGLLALTRIGPDFVFLGGLVVLLVTGILTPTEALEGFGNPGLVTVGALYVVVTGLRDTGGIQWIGNRLLGRPPTLSLAQLKLMAPVAFMSAFLNNTPVVAMMVPAVSDWARKLGFPASKLMIPLSYAAILGGTCTLVGTSTNLIINSLLTRATGGRGLAMFELAWIGVPTALLGLAYLMTVGRWLLPVRQSVHQQFENPREYVVEMLVDPSGPLVGRTLAEAGLRDLGDMYVAEIERGGRRLPVVSPNEHLHAGDRLILVGVVDSAVDVQRIRGLAPATDQVFKLDGARSGRILIEAVVSGTSPIVGRSIREGRFRNRYDAVVLAVSRQGQRVRSKIGDIVLQPGDTLLLEARPAFVQQQRNSRDFFLVSSIEDSTPLRHERAVLAISILAGMVTAVAVGFLSMLEAALIAAGLMLVCQCTTEAAARRNVDWQVLIVIGAALGIGAALQETGAALRVAVLLTGLAGSNPWLNLLVIYLVTTMFTELITNNAAAVLLFPIAIAVANSLGVSFVPFVIAVTMAASASFATPVGYQTNLMVYGPGGYRFGDFFRVGAPLNLLGAALATLVIPLVWRF